ncbi:MAG TPA: molybdopterin cofactor-binding domain-containing protein, partial [Ramlibacter sp.]|nr:molybdopterin cofactor-binding domain-containing protein [Ramlibacter sp.]
SKLEVPPTPTAVGPTSMPEPDAFLQPNVFVTVGTDGSVTIKAPRPDMGQGTRTALPMCLAEELGADWSQVRVEQADAGGMYGNQMAGGSTSIQDFYNTMRVAGAVLNAMLVRAAADQWDVKPEDCTVKDSVVTNSMTQETLPFSALVRTAMTYDPADFRPKKLKDPKDFRLIGTSVPRVEGPELVTGKARFGMDVRAEGMLYAVVARCPVFGGTLVSFDDTAARAVPGVVEVVEITSGRQRSGDTRGVAVVAKDTWSAIRGRLALKVTWDEGPEADLSTEQIEKTLLEKSTAPAPDGVLAAYYIMPFLSHSPMEPINSTVRIDADGIEAWAPTQDPQKLQAYLSNVSDLPADKVRLHVPMTGGGFGRRLEGPLGGTLPAYHIRESYELARAMGVPVKVVWTRDDDMHYEHYHPFSVTRVAGRLDDPASITTRRLDSGAFPIPTGAWRAVENVTEAFAHESFVDEWAAANKQDPLEVRRQTVGGLGRAVLDLAAEKAGWGTPLPAGQGRGIAIHATWGVSPCAQVVEVAVDDKGQVRVLRVVCAINCGIAVNPDMVRQQLEGGILFGLTMALKSQITIAKGRVVQSNFHDYPLLRLDEAPVIETYIVPSTDRPTGIGEMANPPVAAALANAIFAATGKRLRRIPFLPQDIVG